MASDNIEKSSEDRLIERTPLIESSRIKNFINMVGEKLRNLLQSPPSTKEHEEYMLRNMHKWKAFSFDPIFERHQLLNDFQTLIDFTDDSLNKKCPGLNSVLNALMSKRMRDHLRFNRVINTQEQIQIENKLLMEIVSSVYFQMYDKLTDGMYNDTPQLKKYQHEYKDAEEILYCCLNKKFDSIPKKHISLWSLWEKYGITDIFAKPKELPPEKQL
ncbi:MAG: hypothetical protein ACK4NC_00200 [Candidatus Gracilibacteria bacterium]